MIGRFDANSLRLVGIYLYLLIRKLLTSNKVYVYISINQEKLVLKP